MKSQRSAAAQRGGLNPGCLVSRLLVEQLHKGEDVLQRYIPVHIVGRGKNVPPLAAQFEQTTGLGTDLRHRTKRQGPLGGQSAVKGEATAKT